MNLIIQIHLQRVQDFDQYQIAFLIKLHLILYILAFGNTEAYLSQNYSFDKGNKENLQIYISTIIL